MTTGPPAQHRAKGDETSPFRLTVQREFQFSCLQQNVEVIRRPRGGYWVPLIAGGLTGFIVNVVIDSER